MLTKIPRIGKFGLAMLGLVSGLIISASMLHTTTKVNASTPAATGPTIIVKRYSVFKQDCKKQAKDLPLTDKYEARQEVRFQFAYIETDVTKFNGYWRVHFDPAPPYQLDSAKKQTWYVFPSDVTEIRASGN